MTVDRIDGAVLQAHTPTRPILDCVSGAKKGSAQRYAVLTPEVAVGYITWERVVQFSCPFCRKPQSFKMDPEIHAAMAFERSCPGCGKSVIVHVAGEIRR